MTGLTGATDAAVAILGMRPDRAAVFPGSRVTVHWTTRNAHSLRIAGPDGFGVEVDASAGHGAAEVVVHHTGEISALAHGYDGRTVVATTPVAVLEPQRLVEFPEIDLAGVFVPGYQRLAIPLLERTRQSGALLGAACPDAVRSALDRSLRGRTMIRRVTAVLPPPSLCTVTPVRIPRARSIATLFSTFAGRLPHRQRLRRGSGKP